MYRGIGIGGSLKYLMAEHGIQQRDLNEVAESGGHPYSSWAYDIFWPSQDTWHRIRFRTV